MRFIFLLFIAFFSCSDNMLSKAVTTVERVGEYPDIEDMAVTIEQNVTIEDTAPDYEDIWVDHFYQPSVVDGVDIIWVIDPSGSMASHQQRLISGIEAMMNALPPTNWRLAIISSDNVFSRQEDQFPLVPGDDAADAETMYIASRRGHKEAGFDALYSYVVENDYSLTWLRNDAALLVVFVSDEPEQSYNNYPATSDFLAWLTSYRQNTYVASIVNLNPDVSLCNIIPSHEGVRYMEAANYFNGQIIDICSTDWSSGVQDASTQIEPHEYWDLSRTPLDSNFIFVFVNGQSYTDWYYEPSENRVYFNVLPPGNSLVEITYNY